MSLEILQWFYTHGMYAGSCSQLKWMITRSYQANNTDSNQTPWSIRWKKFTKITLHKTFANKWARISYIIMELNEIQWEWPCLYRQGITI